MSSPSPQATIIIGANGYIGRHVCSVFDRNGVPFTATTRGPADHLLNAFSTARVISGASLTDPATCEAVAQARTIILLATASVPSTFSSLREEAQHNLLPFVEIFEHVQPGAKVIYVSSGGAVYGNVAAEAPLIAETAATAPISPYGQTKLFIEEALKFYARTRGFDYVILRPSNPVGPDFSFQNTTAPTRVQGVVTIFLRQIAAGQSLKVFGDGEAQRDYFDVRDLARAIYLVHATGTVRDVTMNVGLGSGTSLNGLIEIIRRQTGRDFQVDYQPSRGFDVRRVVLDTSLVRTAIDWAPEMELAQSVADTWKALSDERRGDE